MRDRARFVPDDEWSPEPQPDGRLGPPGRKTPTAIATAAPRPPRKPDRRGYHGRHNATQRIARGMLSILLVASGAAVPFLQGSFIALATGVGLGGLGILVGARLVRGSQR